MTANKRFELPLDPATPSFCLDSSMFELYFKGPSQSSYNPVEDPSVTLFERPINTLNEFDVVHPTADSLANEGVYAGKFHRAQYG